MCFFFQAEDGIRDLVRSRGLGDVYKRQPPRTSLTRPIGALRPQPRAGSAGIRARPVLGATSSCTGCNRWIERCVCSATHSTASAEPAASRSHTAPRPRREVSTGGIAAQETRYSEGTVVQARLAQTTVGHRFDWYDAVVRWVGALPEETGLWYGVECWQPPHNGKGTDGKHTDRYRRGHRLFSCEYGAGFFVKQESVRTHPDFAAAPAAPTAEPEPEPEPEQDDTGTAGLQRFEAAPELQTVLLVKLPSLALPVRATLLWVTALPCVLLCCW
eukprot:TRINITY_DN18392_c1_g1_i1.p1 TRINITY_DN18392_c1_g1~~TRINITY_DN18392_c1_g1_i1.p1  ORF type:complete len:293 (-),score=62.15 TRINITY_DN18392_c1_g1_i1:18-836(-)